VQRAAVAVAGETVGEIERGLLVLVGVRRGDGPADAAWIARKLAGLRIFADDQGRFDRSLTDIGGAALVVSQFTLYADTRKGRRPSFVEALGGDEAERLYLEVVEQLRGDGVAVQTGRFGADMQVSLINDGPVTIILDSPASEAS